MARASESEQTASVGVSEAMGKFARIGFGYAEITRHDNGTDVFLMARDARRFDLGLTLAAQIKAGPHWFRAEEKDDEGDVIGWWFRDHDGQHIDDWLRHGLPHLLVVHHIADDVTYWVHVTHDAVISTGKGKKILVPAGQRVDDASRDALIAIAATPRPAPQWEGSVWRGAESVSVRDLFRYALLVPRLVAPHPNAHQHMPLTPPQAIALIMQARLNDLQHLEERHLVLPVEEAEQDDEWAWRFYAALHRRVTTGEVDHLRGVQRDAPTPAAQAAAAVAAAAGLMEDDRPDDAIGVLQLARERDVAEPADHAWLSVQLARAHAEIGHVDDARRLAASVQEVAATHSTDVTATAIAGVGAQLLFYLSDWPDADVGNVIEATDTAANWWRQQTRGWALGDAVVRIFREWARDRTTRWSAGDTAHDQLVAASLNASFIGAHGEWGHLVALLGRDMLLRSTRHSKPDEVRAALSTLRLSGEDEPLRLAVERLVSDGPAEAVAAAANETRLDQLTHTTAKTSLSLLRLCGGVLDQDTADSSVTWILRTLADPEAFRRRVRPTFAPDYTLVETLGGTLRSAGQDAHRAVAAYLLTMPAVTDQLPADRWSRVAHKLDAAAWDPATTERAREAAAKHHESLATELLGAYRRHANWAREALLDRVQTGSPEALAAWGPVTDLPPEAAKAAIGLLGERLIKRRRQAATGAVIGYSFDDPHSLTILNLNHPRQAQWEPLLAYLADKDVVARHKAATVAALARGIDDLPVDLRERCARIATTILERDQTRHRFLSEKDDAARGPAALLLARNGSISAFDPKVLRLLHGTADERGWAARVAGHWAVGGSATAKGVLLAMAQDDDPHARARAAAQLVGLIAAGEQDPAIAAAAECAMNDSGLAVPMAMAYRARESAGGASGVAALVERFRAHRFHAVRRAAGA